MVDEKKAMLAREMLLKREYGMFDLIEEMLSEDDIMNIKPRLLRKKIAQLLNMDAVDIYYKTFYSWIFRCKRNNKKCKQALSKKTTTIEKKTSGKVGWENFQPIAPVKQIIDSDSILKKVDYNP